MLNMHEGRRKTVYVADVDRYERIPYRRCGRSGLRLPAISLGLWQSFGDATSHDVRRSIILTAFDSGITHFDLANNYGPPFGAAESGFGRVIRDDLRPYRDEIVISTKAGWNMWPGPYGNWGSRKYLLASLDQSLKRLGIEYVDIFYSHRADPETPLDETMGALETAVRSGKALYAGVSSYSPERTIKAAEILRQMKVPLIINQPSYSMFNRWIEHGLLDVLDQEGIGCIAFSPLAQGLLTSRYIDGIVPGSRATRRGPFSPDMVNSSNMRRVRALSELAQSRGQTLAQFALAWTLRDPRMTSVLVGVSTVDQLKENLGALDNLALSPAELSAIDEHAVDVGINLWAESSES